jgi:hypothetical protein
VPGTFFAFFDGPERFDDGLKVPGTFDAFDVTAQSEPRETLPARPVTGRSRSPGRVMARA